MIVLDSRLGVQTFRRHRVRNSSKGKNVTSKNLGDIINLKHSLQEVDFVFHWSKYFQLGQRGIQLVFKGRFLFVLRYLKLISR